MPEDAVSAPTNPKADAPAAAFARPHMATFADKRAIEAGGYETLHDFETTLDMLAARARTHRDKTAIAFQLTGDPKSPEFRMTFGEVHAHARRLANALYDAGVQPGDTVGVLLPNLPETVVSIFAAHAIGAVNPISPLLEPEIIASILRASGATALITLAPMPKTDVAAKAAAAAALAPKVKTIIEVDLVRYLHGPLKLAAPFLRPRRVTGHDATIIRYVRALRRQSAERLTFERKIDGDAIGAYYHTGGTTGTPKLARHRQRGMVFNAFMAHHLLFREDDVLLAALPLFHVFASYPMALTSMAAGAKLVLLTPQGFRGPGVVDNFWKLVERHRATFFAAVPTAIAALDQRPIDADVSSLEFMLSGSAPLPQALFRRFEETTGVKILEGYGMTEFTCVASCNPPDGERRVGSVGLPLPFVEVKIVVAGADGALRDAAADEIGEICFKGPSIFAGYEDEAKNADVFLIDEFGARWLRTGDLGRVDADGYIWITGRAKDLIIRGGHNIDPGMIEEALARHPAVAFVGAVGQPDAYAGEMPCAYVELRDGRSATADELKAYAAETVAERAARPAAVSILDELPKTAVGKIFKPALRKDATERVFREALAAAGVEAAVTVEDDEALGMIAVVAPMGAVDVEAIATALNGFACPWRLAEGAAGS